MKHLKYFTIKDYETIPLFLKRIKYEMGHLDYTYFSCSPPVGRGFQVLHLVSQSNLNEELKLEVYEDDMPELKKKFEKTILNEKPTHSKPNKKMFSNVSTTIRDLY